MRFYGILNKFMWTFFWRHCNSIIIRILTGREWVSQKKIIAPEAWVRRVHSASPCCNFSNFYQHTLLLRRTTPASWEMSTIFCTMSIKITKYWLTCLTGFSFIFTWNFFMIFHWKLSSDFQNYWGYSTYFSLFFYVERLLKVEYWLKSGSNYFYFWYFRLDPKFHQVKHMHDALSTNLFIFIVN